jgi:hypothetical protein
LRFHGDLRSVAIARELMDKGEITPLGGPDVVV